MEKATAKTKSVSKTGMVRETINKLGVEIMALPSTHEWRVAVSRLAISLGVHYVVAESYMLHQYNNRTHGIQRGTYSLDAFPSIYELSQLARERYRDDLENNEALHMKTITDAQIDKNKFKDMLREVLKELLDEI